MDEVLEKTPGGIYTSNEFNKGMNRETQAFVTATNQDYNTINQVQMLQAVSRIASCCYFYEDNGSIINNYKALSAHALTSATNVTGYFAGMLVQFVVPLGLENTVTAPYLQVNNSPSIQFRDIAPGDLAPGVVSTAIYLLADPPTFPNANFKLLKGNAIDYQLTVDLANQILGDEGAKLVGTTGQTTQQRMDASCAYSHCRIASSSGSPLPVIVTSYNLIAVRSTANGTGRIFFLDVPVGTAEVISVTPETGGSFYSSEGEYFGQPINPSTDTYKIRIVDVNPQSTSAGLSVPHSFSAIIF